MSTINTPRVILANWDGTPRAEVQNYSRFRWIQRWNAVGTWRMTLPRDTIIALIAKRTRLILHYGDLLLTGMVIGVDAQPGNVVGEVVGVNDLAMLAWRLALPEVHGHFDQQSHDVRGGAIETVVKGYVRDNASDQAAIQRRAWPFSVAEDQGRGTVVTGRARFHRLLDYCAGLIAAAGHEHRMVLMDGLFDVVPVRDLTGAPLLADWRSAEWGLTWHAPTATDVYAGGHGEWTARMFAEVLDTAVESEWWKAEDFYDLRAVDDEEELERKAHERLVAGAPKAGFVLRAAAMGHYGVDYFEGDTVTAQARGVAVDAPIMEVAIAYSDDRGWYEEVGVGVNINPFGARGAERERRTRRNIENLEVSK